MIKDIKKFQDLVEDEYRNTKNKLELLGKPHPGDPDNYDTVREEQNIDISDREEIAASIENFETRSAIEVELEKRLNQIRAAKNAILNNTYGTCVICGDPISEERLIANPIALTCVECSSIDNESSSL